MESRTKETSSKRMVNMYIRMKSKQNKKWEKVEVNFNDFLMFHLLSVLTVGLTVWTIYILALVI